MESLSEDTLVRTIRSATQDVFTTMLGLPADVQAHHLEQPSNQPFDGVIGLVGLAGTWVGAGRVSCSAPMACRLSGALLGSEYSAVNEDVLDAMAELTNMIIGNVKSTLEEQLGPMGLSIPTVIFGKNYQARSFGVKEWTVLPFQCGSDLFEVRVALAPNAKAGPDAQRFPVLAEVA